MDNQAIYWVKKPHSNLKFHHAAFSDCFNHVTTLYPEILDKAVNNYHGQTL
jgi:hypothetical protein